jgi:Tfp pilus assembly protein PilN
LTVLVGDDEAVARFTRELGPDWSGDKAALDPFTGLDCAEGTARDPRLAAALGLALRVASGEGPGVNFLEVESRPARQAAEMRRGVALLVALVVAAAGVWTAGVFARLHRLETRYARAREEIRRVFREALPDEPAIVREVEQMAQRLEATRKEHRAFTAAAGAGSSPLHALRALEAAMPKGHGANVAQISIVEGRVTLRGEAGSYESVERLQKTLQAAGAFASVEFGDVEVLPKGGAVRFVLLIRLAAR